MEQGLHKFRFSKSSDFSGKSLTIQRSSLNLSQRSTDACFAMADPLELLESDFTAAIIEMLQ